VQGTAPRSQLLNQFRATANAVLFATSSFWQGVDVAGDALSCVIVDKLPFASPGDPITSADAAILDYVGSLDDGTVFDNSETHGGPQPFTMDAVFPGFAEAMAKMREGGRYHFTMPKKLAFADQAPAGFTGETLTFDVQVRKVVRGGAAMMQQMQAQQQGQAAPEQAAPGQQQP